MKRLSISAASRASGLSRRQITEALNRGEIRFHEPKPGTRRIHPDDLTRWMNSKERGFN